MPPGLVRLIVVPAKSSVVSFRCGHAGRCPRTPARTAVKSSVSALLMAGTTSVRMPSLRQVDRETEADVVRRDQRRLAVDLGERDVHLRVLGDRADQRVADQVREADLAAAGAARWLLMTVRLSASSLAGTARTRSRSAPPARRSCCDDPGGRTAQRDRLAAAGGVARRRAPRPAPVPPAAGASPAQRAAAAGLRAGAEDFPADGDDAVFGADTVPAGVAGFAADAVPPVAVGVPARAVGGVGAPAPVAASSRAPAALTAPGAVASSGGAVVPAPAGSRRRSRARRGRRSSDRPDSAGTFRRRSTRWDRNPRADCPARSAGENTAGLASFTTD